MPVCDQTGRAGGRRGQRGRGRIEGGACTHPAACRSPAGCRADVHDLLEHSAGGVRSYTCYHATNTCSTHSAVSSPCCPGCTGAPRNCACTDARVCVLHACGRVPGCGARSRACGAVGAACGWLLLDVGRCDLYTGEEWRAGTPCQRQTGASRCFGSIPGTSRRERCARRFQVGRVVYHRWCAAMCPRLLARISAGGCSSRDT